MEGLVKEAYEKAIKILEKTSTKHGFFAAFPGYDAVWARDSMITSLGASLLKDKFKQTFKQSIITISKYQSERGQIPNAVDIFSKRKAHIDFQSIDSSLWFVIGNYIYLDRYKDKAFFNSQKSNIEKAMTWISYQDSGEDGMPEQQATSDWQDAFPHRYGHTINTQALYYKALLLTGRKKQAQELKKTVNTDKDKGLWDKDFYLAYRWKNHNKYHEKGEWFDSLGNLLAIVFGLADKSQSNKILNHINKNRIDKPYPIKSIFPAIKKTDKEWHDYFDDCDARTPHHYLNAGIWTYIGGFYVLSLIKTGRFKQAEKQLEKLAEANMQLNGSFSEWLNGKTGKPPKIEKNKWNLENSNQSWNAGIYILAYSALKEKKIFI